MRARAEQTRQTRQRIVDAAYALFMELPYDEVTLQAVSDRAGVAVQTLLRHVGSKEGLVRYGLEEWNANEYEQRRVPPGDVDAVGRVLAERYEALDGPARLWDLEARVPVVHEAMNRARRGHLDWLADVFAADLPARPATVRRLRLAQLFGATEQKVWVLWRTSLGLSRPQAQRAMTESLRAIVESWRAEHQEGGG